MDNHQRRFNMMEFFLRIELRPNEQTQAWEKPKAPARDRSGGREWRLEDDSSDIFMRGQIHGHRGPEGLAE